MPTTRKELHFFDREEENTNYKKYHANFKPKPQQRLIGEASPIYMYWETAPSRIWKYNPKMKWILALRNPVERASYLLSLRGIDANISEANSTSRPRTRASSRSDRPDTRSIMTSSTTATSPRRFACKQQTPSS